MKRYNVLWIDDQPNEVDLMTNAELSDIDITHFYTSKEGMDAFCKEIYKWDGVILDAKCWMESNDETAETDALYRSIDILNEFAPKRKVPYFVYTGQFTDTGQLNIMSSKEFIRVIRKPRYYKKGVDEEELFEDIKKDADELMATHIRHKYADVYEIYPFEDLIKILACIENNDTKNASIFNDIRKVLEWIIKYCIQCGLSVPFKGANLGECSKFLAKDEMKPYVPLHIQRSFHSCVTVANDANHTMQIDKIVKDGEVPYLIRSTVFELLNILYWCKDLPTNEEHIEKLRAKTSIFIFSKAQEFNESDIIEGVVEQDGNRNYHCMEYLLPYSKGEEVIGKTIKILKFADNDKPQTKQDYPHFIQKFEIID